LASEDPPVLDRRQLRQLPDRRRGRERVRETYGDNFDRLVEVKTAYDPDNLFRANRNIRPRA
jgi:FAD/FMN-containing dehydrogenase